jgi:MOSC domain-containing protein YiiM
LSERGTVLAVCLNTGGGIPRQPQERVLITPAGVEGDFHAGEFDAHGRPNRRQVTVVGVESTEAVGADLNVEIPPGGLGENILVRGLGDLSELVAGQRLRFSTGVELEITGQNEPCNNLSVYHRLAVKKLYGRRGLLTIVSAGGELSPGDSVEVLAPSA